jgi:hypothetical protein
MSAPETLGQMMASIINETARKIVRRHLLPSIRNPVNDNVREP